MVNEEFTGALSVLTHEMRVRILRTLADADDALSFTELKSRVDAADSGRFNYHLRELCDHFVRESDDGYSLSYRGKSLVIAGASGVSVGDSEATRGSSGCPVCGDADCDRLVHVPLASGP
jgi:hypothetical protein